MSRSAVTAAPAPFSPILDTQTHPSYMAVSRIRPRVAEPRNASFLRKGGRTAPGENFKLASVARGANGMQVT